MVVIILKKTKKLKNLVNKKQLKKMFTRKNIIVQHCDLNFRYYMTYNIRIIDKIDSKNSVYDFESSI